MKAWILLLLAIPFSAQAATYHRFWRGEKLAALPAQEFQDKLNATFLPATVQTGGGHGLIAYEPVLTLGEHGLPDEIALVSYADSAAYAALMATAAGKAYVALHWTLFDQSKSASVVPEPYAGAVALEQAYDLHPEYAGWESGTTVVLVGFRHAGESDAAYLARFRAELESSPAGVSDRAAFVTSAYWLDYVSASGPQAAREAAAGAELVLPVESGAVGSVELAPGRGVNLRMER